MRRIGIAGTVVAVTLLTTAGVALAAGTPRVNSPFEGSAVNTATPVRVSVDEQCGPLDDPPTGRVDVRLSADGASAYPGSSPVALDRVSECTGSDPGSEWGGVTIDPASPTAFFGAGAPPMCNGRWRVQPRADGGAWAAGVSFVVSRPPVAPSGLEVSPTGDTVAVSWVGGTEPDLAGYRVERRRAGGTTWSLVDDVGAGTSRVLDRGLADGDYEYRVIALRPDGVSGGAPVGPCQDQEADLRTASSVAAASVGEPEPAPSPSPSPGASPGPGEDADGGDPDGDDGGGSGGTDGTDGAEGGDGSGGSASDPDATDGGAAPVDGEPTGEESPGDGTAPRRGRVAAPPAASGGGGGVEAPELSGGGGGQQTGAAAAPPQERYYGEDLEFSQELDFGSVEPIGSTDTRRRSTVEERIVPQAVRHFVERFVDPDRVLKPVALGLLLMVVALHLVRWTRESDGG